MVAPPADPSTLPLPELRQDLRLETGAADVSGAATWLVVDPVQHRFIQISEGAYQILSCWQTGLTYGDLAKRVTAQYHQDVSIDDIARFVRFVGDTHLTVEPATGGWRYFAMLADRASHGWVMWLVHNYLYVRVPLLRPEPELRRMLPWLAPIFTRTFVAIIAAIGALGLYLVSRQWDQFSSTFQYFFSWEGAGIYAVALIFVKSFHELGHAFTALRFGCRVPSMGVCFMVMMPMLYTDVTDAWRLTDRRQRLLIGGAGMAVELMLACVATLLWSFLPDGIAKSLAFSVATIGWVLSLMVNLNPLMRFDGYYLMSDFLGVDNLQQRSFEFGRWRLREILFGLGAPPPEVVSKRTERTLTVYAWATWIYRLILFTGIALVVYHMAFKLLGIVLFLIEIIFFIARPIAAEAQRWWQMRDTIKPTRRTKWTAAAALGLVAVFIVPWSTRITIPAVLEAEQLARVFPQRPGTVVAVKVKAGDVVAAGDPLVVLQSDDVAYRLRVAMRQMELIKLRLNRRSSDDEDRSRSLSLEQEYASLASQIEGIQREAEELTVRAPASGHVVELNPSLHDGRTVGRNEFVALIRGDGGLVARGYVAEQDIERVEPASRGVFVPELPGWPRVPVVLKDVAQAGASNIELPELASQHGGRIAVRPRQNDGKGRRLSPVDARYLAVLSAEGESPEYAVRGVVLLQGDAQSLAVRAWRVVASVLVRESGI